MQLKSSHVVLLLAPLLVVSAFGQGSLGPKPKKARAPEDYRPRALKEVAAKGPDAGSRENKEETMLVHADIFPSRVRATYAGSARPLPPLKREVLRQWARLYAGSLESYTAPYETELLFKEEGMEYWLAVRKELVARFGREVERGDAVDLYLIRLGEAKTSDKWEPVLLAESFQKPE